MGGAAVVATSVPPAPRRGRIGSPQAPPPPRASTRGGGGGQGWQRAARRLAPDCRLWAPLPAIRPVCWGPPTHAHGRQCGQRARDSPTPPPPAGGGEGAENVPSSDAAGGVVVSRRSATTAACLPPSGQAHLGTKSRKPFATDRPGEGWSGEDGDREWRWRDRKERPRCNRPAQRRHALGRRQGPLGGGVCCCLRLAIRRGTPCLSTGGADHRAGDAAAGPTGPQPAARIPARRGWGKGGPAEVVVPAAVGWAALRAGPRRPEWRHRGRGGRG